MMPTSSPLSRRAFLRSSALAGLATAASSSDAAAAPGFIDAHVHVWTPDTSAYPLAEGFTPAKMQPASFTPEQLFAHCRPEGVSRIVLIQMSFYKTDNRYMLDMMAKHPGVFGGVAIIDETQPNLRETMRSLASQGVRGFRLYTDKAKAEAWSSSAAMKAMWSHAADFGMAMCLLTGPEALPAIDAMCQAYPRTRVVIDHFARIGASGTINEAEVEALCRLAKHSETFVKTSAFYAFGAKAAPYTDLGPMVKKLRDSFGANRLMWASDCPFQVEKGHTYRDSIALIRDRLDFLSAADKQALLHDTAAKVFF